MLSIRLPTGTTHPLKNPQNEQTIVQLTKLITQQPINKSPTTSSNNNIQKLSTLYTNRGVLYFQLGRGYDQWAIADFQRAVELNRFNAVAYFDMFVVEGCWGQEEEEEEGGHGGTGNRNNFGSKGNGREGHLMDALKNLCCALSCLYLIRGHNTKNESDINKAIKYAQNNYEARLIRALQYTRKGKYLLAMNQIQWIMDVQGNNGDGDGELNDGSMDMSMRRKISHIGRYLQQQIKKNSNKNKPQNKNRKISRYDKTNNSQQQQQQKQIKPSQNQHNQNTQGPQPITPTSSSAKNRLICTLYNDQQQHQDLNIRQEISKKLEQFNILFGVLYGGCVTRHIRERRYCGILEEQGEGQDNLAKRNRIFLLRDPGDGDVENVRKISNQKQKQNRQQQQQGKNDVKNYDKIEYNFDFQQSSANKNSYKQEVGGSGSGSGSGNLVQNSYSYQIITSPPRFRKTTSNNSNSDSNPNSNQNSNRNILTTNNTHQNSHINIQMTTVTSNTHNPLDPLNPSNISNINQSSLIFNQAASIDSYNLQGHQSHMHHQLVDSSSGSAVENYTFSASDKRISVSSRQRQRQRQRERQRLRNRSRNRSRNRNKEKDNQSNSISASASASLYENSSFITVKAQDDQSNISIKVQNIIVYANGNNNDNLQNYENNNNKEPQQEQNSLYCTFSYGQKKIILIKSTPLTRQASEHTKPNQNQQQQQQQICKQTQKFKQSQVHVHKRQTQNQDQQAQLKDSSQKQSKRLLIKVFNKEIYAFKDRLVGQGQVQIYKSGVYHVKVYMVKKCRQGRLDDKSHQDQGELEGQLEIQRLYQNQQRQQSQEQKQFQQDKNKTQTNKQNSKNQQIQTGQVILNIKFNENELQ